MRWFAIPTLAAFIFAVQINLNQAGLMWPLFLLTAVWLWRWEVLPVESWDDELEQLLKAGR